MVRSRPLRVSEDKRYGEALIIMFHFVGKENGIIVERISNFAASESSVREIIGDSLTVVLLWLAI